LIDSKFISHSVNPKHANCGNHFFVNASSFYLLFLFEFSLCVYHKLQARIVDHCQFHPTAGVMGSISSMSGIHFEFLGVSGAHLSRITLCLLWKLWP